MKWTESMGFVFNNTTIDMPKLTDLFNNSTGPAAVVRTLTYAWIWALGGWFFAFVIGGLAAVLYIKYQKAMVPVVFLLLMIILYSSVLTATPLGFPSAEAFVYVAVVIGVFSIGFMLFKIFIGKR